jgi:hypothetical protein
MHMIGLVVVAVVLAVETLVFSAPARIPAIKRRAMSSRIWRWGAIVLLASLPTLVHIFGFLWTIPAIEVILGSPYSDFGYTFSQDSELRDDLITELRWRNFIAWDNERCFTGNVVVCDAADKWRAVEAERAANQRQYDRSLSDWIANFVMFGIFLSPSLCTGYAVYRITQDTRKQKRSSLSSL